MPPFCSHSLQRVEWEKAISLLLYVLTVLIKVHEPTVDIGWWLVISTKIAIMNKYSSFLENKLFSRSLHRQPLELGLQNGGRKNLLYLRYHDEYT